MAGHSKDRLCTNCGLNPRATTDSIPKSEPTFKTIESSNSARRKRQNQHLLLKLLSALLLLIAMILLGVRKLRHTDASEKPIPATAANAADEQTAEDFDLLRQALPQCVAMLSGFLASNTPEERNQFVFSPISTASRMDRFYALNPAIRIDPKNLSLIHKSVLHLPGAKAIETHWKSKDGQYIDAVFHEENGEWRLDWEHFIRFGDYPWSLFLAGSGPAEGEFRLLARERLAEERKDAESISLVFYAPRFGNPEDAGPPSPGFLISRNTRDARLLDAAFQNARSGKRIFDLQLPDLNPEEMIPVRIKVRRIETDLSRSFEITSVTTCHWYSLDDPGVEPLAPEAVAPEGTK